MLLFAGSGDLADWQTRHPTKNEEECFPDIIDGHDIKGESSSQNSKKKHDYQKCEHRTVDEFEMAHDLSPPRCIDSEDTFSGLQGSTGQSECDLRLSPFLAR